jgi:hypothetical protein
VGKDGLPNPSGPISDVEPDWKVQLMNLATFELYRRKFLESVYEDALGYQVFKIK